MRALKHVLLAGSALAFVPFAQAETQTEINNQTRTVVYFDMADETIDNLLPEGWSSTPIAAGAFKGADLVLVFIDGTLVTDADGKPLATGSVNKIATFAIPATDGQADAPVTFIVALGFGADAAAIPGFYNTYVAATVKLARTEESGEGLATTLEESWEVDGADGASIDFSFKAAAAAPTLTQFNQRVVSGADPSRYRFYRGNQGTDVLKSTELGMDRTERMSFAASGGGLSEIFDGSEVLLGVADVPWYHRETFIP